MERATALEVWQWWGRRPHRLPRAKDSRAAAHSGEGLLGLVQRDTFKDALVRVTRTRACIIPVLTVTNGTVPYFVNQERVLPRAYVSATVCRV